jgi:hypothetical protein
MTGRGQSRNSVVYQLAILEEGPVWPCKIGKSGTGDPVERVTSQCQTSWHTLPEIPLVIRTDDSEGIEKLIHGVFDVVGLRIENDGCGKEWFITNPQQIEACYLAINDCLLKLRSNDPNIGSVRAKERTEYCVRVDSSGDTTREL